MLTNFPGAFKHERTHKFGHPLPQLNLPKVLQKVQPGESYTTRKTRATRKHTVAPPLATERAPKRPVHSRTRRTPSQRKRLERQKRTPSAPLTAAAALKLYSNELTPFEQSEILEFNHIHFIGNPTSKVRGLPQTPLNDGYDDDHG
eukprot:60192_1